MSGKLAVVTMVYNEPDFLPIWLKYYGGQVGESACYIVDHGSTDGSTSTCGDANILKIPRSPMDDRRRAAFISEFCSSLLRWYDAVIYVDVDEILIPDPAKYGSLIEIAEKTSSPALCSIGLNIYHLPDEQPPIDWSLPILAQRRYAAFRFAMCKPLLIKSPTIWTPGFHSSSHPLMFDSLFLFHLHNFDLPYSLKRLTKTREMPWADLRGGSHQRVSDQELENHVRANAGLPKKDVEEFSADNGPLADYQKWISDFVKNNPDKRHDLGSGHPPRPLELFKIPDRFLPAF